MSDASAASPWVATQAEVWGTKDPEVFGRVVARLKMIESKMLREMEQAISVGAPTHTVAWIAVNYVLRGCGSSAEYMATETPDGMEWDAFAHKWVAKGPKTGPAITHLPQGA